MRGSVQGAIGPSLSMHINLGARRSPIEVRREITTVAAALFGQVQAQPDRLGDAVAAHAGINKQAAVGAPFATDVEGLLATPAADAAQVLRDAALPLAGRSPV